MYSNNKNIHAHNGKIPDTPILHSNEEFAGCHLNSGSAPTSVKPAPPKQSTTSVLRQWRRPDTVDSGPKHVPAKYTKVPVDNPGYPAALDNPAEYSMYTAQQPHSTAVPANRPYLSHVQYGESTGYNRASPVKQVPDSVVKYGSAGQYYAQDGTGEVHYRGGNYPGQSTPPLAHSANAKVTPGYADGHSYASGTQKPSPNYHYPMVPQGYHQNSKSTSDEQNSYCLKSGTYPAQNRVPQHGPGPNGHPNVAYTLQTQLDRRQSPQESSQPYYVNKSACLSQELRHGRQSYAVDKPGGYPQVYAQSYLAQKPSPQEQKSREYRQIVQSPTKKSPPFPILEQRLSAEGSFYPEYGAGAYAHHKYGPVMLPGATQKNYLNTSGPKFPPEDIIPSTYAKYYSQNKVTYEPNHYLLQMNQMQTRLNPNLFTRSSELPRDVAYMDQTSRGLQKTRIQYNAIEANQYGAKSSSVGIQKPAKLVTYTNLQDQRLAEHPSGEYFRNYPKPQSVIQSSKMLMDSYSMQGRTEAVHEPQSYTYSPPLIHQGNRPALAQYPTNYRPSAKTTEVSSGNISPRRTFQENMPVVVIPPQCIGLPKVSPPQYSVPGQEYPQMYQNYLPKESYYPGPNMKPGNVQYRNDQLVKQPVHVTRNIQVQAPRVQPTYPGAQYQQSSPDGTEKIYYPARSIYGQQVIQPANPSYSSAYCRPDYRGYEAASVVRSAYAKKEVDIGKSLKEYLESWEDDEDIVTNLPDVVLCNNIPAEKQKHVSFAEPISEAKTISPADETASEPLYILDSTNISSEALSQYLHIQQIDHLPANIKGYYKLPGEMPAEPLEKSSRPAADQKLQHSKDHELKTAETKAELHTRQSEGLGRVAEKAETPETQAVTVELLKMDPKTMLCAQDYSKTRELNILEVTELRIPEISAELAENAAESISPQDYSVNKRGAAEMSETSEASRFQNCLPQDFSITRKSDAEKLSEAAEVTVEPIPRDYSINKPNGPERLLLAEAGQLSASESTTEGSVIHPDTPEDYSESLQEDVALNLSTNRSKFEENSEDSHLLREILREADSSIIEDHTKPLSASKLQGVLQRSNEECSGLHDEDKVSSSNTRNLQPESCAKKFSSKLNEDESSSVAATEVIEAYMEIQQKSDSKLDVTKPAAVIQMHTASVIVQNTFFDDKSSSKTLSEPFVLSSTPQIVQKFHQELENYGRTSESDCPSLQSGEPSINSQKQLTNCISFNSDDQNVETATLQYNSQSFDSFSADAPCYESFEESDFGKEVKQYRKKSLLHDYKLKMEENSSEESSSECSEDEDDYTRQRTENEDASKVTKHDRCSGIETSDSEDRELFTSDNSDGEFDKERTEDSSTEDVTTKRTTEASARKYRKRMSSTNEETTEEELYQSSKEDQNIQGASRPSTADDAANQDETSQSTTTEEDTDEPAQSTTDVKGAIGQDETSQSTVEAKSTIGQDETSQSTIKEECNLEESSTIAEKDCQESEKEQSTIRFEELGDNIQKSTVALDELSEGTTGEVGTIPGDGSQSTTDEESTIIQDEETEEVKGIGTTEPILHQSTGEIVQDEEIASTTHNQAVPEDAMVENAEENLKDQENRLDNSALHQELATNNNGIVEDCTNLANNSSEPSQQCNKVATSNNSSESLQEHNVCECKKLATFNTAQASVQEDSAASQQCNKIVTSNNARETVGENSDQYAVLDQECKAAEIIELDNDNQEDISSVDNHVMLCDAREATSSSQSCSEDTASESEGIKDYNDPEQSENTEFHCEDSCFLGNSTCKSEDRNLQTNTEEYDDGPLQSQDTKLIIDTEEIENITEQDFDATLQFEDTVLQYEDTEFNSVLHSEDEDTLRNLEELRDVSLQSEDVDLQSEDVGLQSEDLTLQTEDTVLLSEGLTLEAEDTVLQTSTTETEVILEDISEEVSLPAEENVPELKKHKSLINCEDDSCEANKSALSDRSTLSSKSEDFLIENLISIDRDTHLQETDSFEREMEDIFKNISKDTVVPVNMNQVPETYPLVSEVACLETITAIQDCIQPETPAPSTDNLFKPQTLDDPELETDHSGRTGMVANVAETVALSQNDLPSRDFAEELSTEDDEIPVDLVEASIATVSEVASPEDVLSADECLVIFGAADDFVILQEPETIEAETIVIEDVRIAGDTEELVGEQLGTEPEAIDGQMPPTDVMIEEIVGESEEHVEELVASPTSTADEFDICENLVGIPPDTIRADPVDKGLNKRSEVLIEKQGIANNQTKLTVQVKLNQNQELSEKDSVRYEELQQTHEETQVQMPADEVKSEQAAEELHLVSEIEVAEHFLQDIKHEIKEESPTQQKLEMEGVGTIEEFKIDVKEEIVNLEICAEDVQVEDAKVEELIDNVDLKAEVVDCKKNVQDQLMRKEDDAGATVKDKRPEKLVKEDLLGTDTVSVEKMEDNTSLKNDKEGREELEEGELSDQSETETEVAQEVKTDLVIDDWNEPEELLRSIQLQMPISQEKKLLFARRKKNLEKLKAKFLLAKQTQLDSKASQIHTPAVEIPEALVPSSTVQSKPSKTTFQVSPSEVHSPDIPKPESNNRRCSSSSKSVKLCQFPKCSPGRSSINSAPHIPDIGENSFTTTAKFSTTNLAKPTNVRFNPDEKLFQPPTTYANTKGCSKPSTTEETPAKLSFSSKYSSSSLESKSSSSKSVDLSQCASAETSSKSKGAFQLPSVFKPFRASVEDKELFINPENPRYQPSTAGGFDSSASRKRSLSNTDYSGLKIEFTAPKRRYSAMEAARPVRKPIINLDEISQNISQVLKQLDSSEKRRKITYNQRPETVERAGNEAKIVAESQSKEKWVNQEGKKQNERIFYTPTPNKLPNDNPERKQRHTKLDHFKVFEKMAQRKSLKVLPANLYDGEECVLNDISGRKVLDSGSISEESTAASPLGVSEGPTALDRRMDNDQRLSTNKFSTPSRLEDHKIISTDVQRKETSSVQVSKTPKQADSAHHMSKPQQSKTLTAVKSSTPQFVSSHQPVEGTRDVTNMEVDPGESSEGIASSHQLGDSARGPLTDVPSTLVDPVLVLPKVSCNTRTKKICGVKNGQTKQQVKLPAKLCKGESEKSLERTPGNAESKENSQEKLKDGQMKQEEGKSNVPQSKEDNEAVINQIAMSASQEQSQPKMLGNQETSILKQKERNEDSQAKMKDGQGRQKVKTSNQKLETNKECEKTQVTVEDCLINLEGGKEDEAKEDGQVEVQGSEQETQKIKDNQIEIKTSEDTTVDIETEEYIQTKKNVSSICAGGTSTLQCDKNKSDIARSGDASAVNSSAAVLDTSPHKQDDSTDLLASSSSNEDLSSNVQSNTQTVSSNVSPGPIIIKSSSTSNNVEQPKPQASSSNAKLARPESQRTSVNGKSSLVNMKSGKLNAIIAKLGSANLQTGALKAQATYSANVTGSSAAESLASLAVRSFESSQGSQHLSSAVTQRNSSGDQQDSLAGSKAATVDQLVAPEGLPFEGVQLRSATDQNDATVGKCASGEDQLASLVDQGSAIVDRHSATVGQLISPAYQIAKSKKALLMDQRPNNVVQGCSPNVTASPKITNTSSSTLVQCSTLPKANTRPLVSPSIRNSSSNIPSTHRDTSKFKEVSGKLHETPPSCNTSSSNTSSFSVIVEPTVAKRKASDPRNDILPTDVKKAEGFENKLSNTFRLTEYTKSYIKLKMSQEMDPGIVNGQRQTDPRLGQKPTKNCSQQLKRKLPNSETDTTVTAGSDKRVKINLQDYRNRKQHSISSNESKIEVDHRKNNGDDSFDDCLGEVVNGIDDFMTVIETNEQYGIADDNLGLEMTDLEIFMDDSMELIPGNEEIVHTSKEEDVLSECLDNSGTEELESSSSQDRIKVNPTHRPAAGARKMRIRMICKPDSAINQARFEDVSYPGPSKVRNTEDADQDRNEKIPLPKTAMVKLTKETAHTNTNRSEPNATNTLTRRRTKSKGEMKMYRPKRRKKRFRNLYTTDEDEESELPTTLTRRAPEMLPNDLATASGRVRSREETVASSEAIQDSRASPEDYSHLVTIEPASYKYRIGTRKHLLRGEESQETNSSSSGDLPQLSRRQGYQHRLHKRAKSNDHDDDSLPSCSDSSEAFSRKLEYKCHINLNALGSNCKMLTGDPVQPSTSKMGLKLTLKSVRKESEVLDCLDTSPTSRRSKHGKRKVPRKEHSAYSVSTSAANRAWTLNDKVPKVIIKRNGSGYCAVSRDVTTNPIWQPVIRVRRHRYIESLVRQGKEDSVP